MISDEDISLAWSPMPPFESTGAGDCRPGGNCGLDFNAETRRANWARARHRFLKDKRERSQFSLLESLSLDPVHRPCRCARCVAKRLMFLFTDLDREYGPKKEALH